MDNRLRALIAISATVFIGGGVIMLGTPDKPGVTWAKLLDAGLADQCEVKQASCPALFTESGLGWAKDAGLLPSTHVGRYAQVRTLMAKCSVSDAGAGLVVIPDLPTDDAGVAVMRLFAPSFCAKSDCGECSADPYPLGFVADEMPCAWRPVGVDAGSCVLLDGGNPGSENTKPATQLVGPGCVRKVCVELPGLSSDPQGRTSFMGLRVTVPVTLDGGVQ